jgi:hypothetical protein
MNPLREEQLLLTRRHFFGRLATGIGTAALASLLDRRGAAAAQAGDSVMRQCGLPGVPHFAPKAKRIIYLHMAGGPSQIELYDHKPLLEKLHNSELPDSVRMGQRITTMTSGQSAFPVVKPIFQFRQHGQCGAWMSELIPHIGSIADDLCVLKTVNTEAINHDPAITFIQTGFQQPGRPCMGAWLSYGLGTLNENLPAFIVMISSGKESDQPLYTRLWSAGFLPSEYQGVQFRGGGDPVLFLSNPPGLDAASRRRMLDGLARLNQRQYEAFGDPEIPTRIAQYEMAFRMQTSVPELTDLAGESDATRALYGPKVNQPGSFAHSALLARRLVERGVRAVQILHRGWDQHDNLPVALRNQCEDTDQPTAGLIRDLKQRGLLDSTLVVWGGEFGRTVYSQGQLTPENYGRDHHPRNFCVWLAGGGVKGGICHGETDDFSYNIVDQPVHVNDLNATLLHCLGIDHERFTFKFQGLDQRLTGVEPSHVVKAVLA